MPIQKSIGLKGKSEWAGARKILAALKRARKIKGPVKLVQHPAAPAAPTRRRRVRRYAKPRYVPTEAQWRAMRATLSKAKRYANPKKRRRNIAGFMRDGVFHPIRSGERMITYRGKRVLVKDDRPYSRRKAHEKPKRRNTTYASFQRQGRKRKKKTNPKRLTKKQEFLRRMRLGRLRAARARKRQGR